MAEKTEGKDVTGAKDSEALKNRVTRLEAIMRLVQRQLGLLVDPAPKAKNGNANGWSIVAIAVLSIMVVGVIADVGMESGDIQNSKVHAIRSNGDYDSDGGATFAARVTCAGLDTTGSLSGSFSISGTNISGGNIAVARITNAAASVGPSIGGNIPEAALSNALRTATAVGSATTTLDGEGGSITNLSAANIQVGTAASAFNGAGITNLSAANIAAGTAASAFNGLAITNLNAANLKVGTALPAVNGGSVTNLAVANMVGGFTGTATNNFALYITNGVVINAVLQ